MQSLSNRNKLIIQYLLNHGQTTSKELGEVLSVTDRTIKSDMLAIKSVIEKYGADLISTRGKGYEIVIHDSVSFGVIRNVLNREMTMLIPKTSQERILYLVRKLLMVDFEISIQELTEELYVDRSTLNLDMKDVRKIFDNYSLQVESSNKGLLLVGSEIQKRRCICDFFFQNQANDVFALDGNENTNTEKNEKEMRYIREALLNVLNKYQITFSNYSIENMEIHIMVAIRRYQFYQYVSFEDSEIANLKETKAYSAAKDLKVMLENQFSIILPESEVAYLAIHIQSKAIVTNSKVDTQQPDVDELLYNIYRRISKRFNLSFFLNSELNELLKLHIPAMVNRVKNQLFMRNPLLYETMRQYQFAVEVCIEAVDEIENWYNIEIDENEFAYLVLYFNLAIQKQKVEVKKRIVLVCGNGRPEMILMLNQLNERFSNQLSDIVTVDLLHLNSFHFEENDILISTIPLSIEVDIPMIYLQGHNNLGFQEMYDVISNSRHVKINMGDYLTRERFHENLDLRSKEEVLISLKEMLSSEIGEDKAEGLVWGMFPKFSELGKKCVLLHSLKDVNEPIIEFISLKNEVLWNKTYVKYIFFSNCNNLRLDVIESIYYSLSHWCSKESKYIADYDQFIELLNRNLMNKTYGNGV